MAEAWKSIPATDGAYEASSLGRVRSKDRIIRQPGRWGGEIECLRRGQVLKPWADANGYLVVYLAKRKAVNVHRLVALAFHGEGGALDVNHLDGDKQNNRPENLEWVTRAENMAHAQALGLGDKRKPIIGTPKNGGGVLEFESASAAARHLQTTSAAIVNSMRRGHACRGLRWRYAEAA